MQCGMARSWMQSRRDTALSAPQERELDQHVMECADCTAFGRDLRLVDSWLQQAPVEEPAANFEWRLKLRLAQLEREGRQPALPARGANWRPWLQFGGAMATAALVVVIAGSQWLQSRPAAPDPAPLAWERSNSHPSPDEVLVTPLRDERRAPPAFVGPPSPPSLYFVGAGDSSVSALDSARTPNSLEAR